MKSVSQRLLRGGIIAVIGKSSIAIGIILVNALVARLLSPAETGIFLLSLSMVTVAAVIADFGFGKTMLRVIPDAVISGDQDRAMSHIKQAFIAVSLTVICTALILVSPAGTWLAEKISHGEILGELMPLVALWLVVTVVMSLLAETCRGFHHIAAAIFFGGALTGLGNILIVSITLAAVWISSAAISLKQLLLLFIVTGMILSLLALLNLRKRFQAHQKRESSASVLQLFKMAWPFWVSSMALILMTHAEIWLLGYLRPPEEVAAFGLVARLALLVSFPLVIVNSVLPPLISELYANDDINKMERMLRGSAGLTTLFSLLVFLVLLVLGDWLPQFLFGDVFAGNWHIMMILAVGWLFHVWAGSGGFVLNMTDNQKSAMIINIFVGAITLTGGYWLTDMYGGLGMAIASTSGIVLVNIIMLLVIKAKLDIRIFAGVSALLDVKNELAKRLQSPR